MRVDNCDLHTHTTYSDGRSPVDDNVRGAEAAGLDAIAIADHLFPEGSAEFGDRGRLRERLAEVQRARAWASVRVIMAVEATALDLRGAISVGPEDLAGVELVLVDLSKLTAGVGFAVPDGRLRQLDALFGLYSRLAEIPWVDVLAHPFNLGRFGLDLTLSDLPEGALRDLGQHLKAHGVACELISTFWWWWPQLHPDQVAEEYARVVRALAAGGACFTLASDAHANCSVGNLAWAQRVARLAEFGPEQWADLDALLARHPVGTASTAYG